MFRRMIRAMIYSVLLVLELQQQYVPEDSLLISHHGCASVGERITRLISFSFVKIIFSEFFFSACHCCTMHSGRFGPELALLLWWHHGQGRFRPAVGGPLNPVRTPVPFWGQTTYN